MERLISFLQTEHYHALIRECTNDEEFEDEDTKYVCFNVAKVVFELAKMRLNSYEEEEIEASFSSLRNEGVYHVHISNSFEDHLFVAWVHDGKITLIQGYGGYYGNPLIHTYPAEEFIEKMNSSVSCQEMDEYLHLPFRDTPSRDAEQMIESIKRIAK